ncbi:hypothetical protein MTP16_00925 [Hymenobacter monticola]|uniref:Uncharacterized protein n=1 Tax=Hymenobacter monticola TaxID=1705399 RepID=A0ABY4B8Y6_9BACT|nr:hypothetical protein [Hymenobacter monticola]UOE34228.1 hypothetical protein MTP16_00925 [Hymenobacter monticola]
MLDDPFGGARRQGRLEVPVVAVVGFEVQLVGVGIQYVAQAGGAEQKLLLVGRQRGPPRVEPRLVGHGQRVAQPAHHGVVQQVHLLAAVVGGQPDAAQRVLQHRQLVLALPNVIQQALHQPLADAVAAEQRRPLDDFLKLVAQQPGHKVLAGSHLLYQPPKLGALPHKVGAHGAHYVNGQVLGLGQPGGFQQQVHHGLGGGVGLVAVVVFGVGEKLLKLVHHQQQVGGLPLALALLVRQRARGVGGRGAQLRGLVELHQRGKALFQLGFHRAAAVRQPERRGQRLGQVAQGAALGAESGHGPAAVAGRHKAGPHLGQHPGKHERRLAVARGAGYHHKPLLHQQGQALGDVALAAPEVDGLVFGEGAQAGIGTNGFVEPKQSRRGSGKNIHRSRHSACLRSCLRQQDLRIRQMLDVGSSYSGIGCRQ